MIRNYITIAFRSIMRNKSYSAINILGLSVGVACCLLLALYVQHEMNYDRHHTGKENIYRITTTLMKNEEKLDPMGRTSAPIAWGIKEDVPEFETVARLVNPPGVALNLVKYGEKQLYEPEGYIADATLFSIFTYDFIEGDPQTALSHPNSVVITDRLAEKIFGNEPAVEKVISIAQGGPEADYKVTGVVKDNQRSHLHANFFVSMNSNSQWCDFLRSNNVMNEWAGQNFFLSYVKLRPGHSPEDVKIKMNEAFMKHGAEDLKALGFSKELGLELITDIHLFSETSGEKPGIVYIYIIVTIGSFILLIACINFINLSTARAVKRANEVGLRKTLGAYRSSLIGQFLSEAGVIVLISIIISVMIVQIALPAFNGLTGKEIGHDTLDLSVMIWSLLGIATVTGLIAGSYPAFYLSSFQPARVLKGKFVLSANSFLRRSLVVFQFVIAIVLVCGMIIVGKQLRFIQQKDLGFDIRQKVVLPLRTSEVQEHVELMGHELKKIPSVSDYTATNYIPGSPIFTDFHLYPQGGNMDVAIRFRRNPVEPNYLNVLGIEIIAGRNFHANRTTDVQKNVIVNREAAKQLGFTSESIIGQTLYNDWQGNTYEYQVIGVMENYHHTSLKEAIYPVMFFIPEDMRYDYAIIDTETNTLAGSLADIERIWKQLNPGTPFEYTLLEDNIAKQYTEDRRVSKLIGVFTIIAIVISCLGLYGLSTYMAERRFKEIGVRKVMGASVRQIVAMMSGEFVRLVLIAFIIAIPIAWYGSTQWLENFAYRITPGFEMFLLAGAIALFIALVTISFESFRAASANPVNSLRNE